MKSTGRIITPMISPEVDGALPVFVDGARALFGGDDEAVNDFITELSTYGSGSDADALVAAALAAGSPAAALARLGFELVEFADMAALLAAAPTADNPTFFFIPYDDFYMGEGQVNGVIFNGKISLFGWAPFSILGGTWSASDLTNTGVAISVDGTSGYTRFVKTAGNSSAINVIIQNSLEFHQPEIFEVDCFYSDTSASGDRLSGFGFVDANASNVLVNGNAAMAVAYRFSGSWVVYMAIWTIGSYSVSLQTFMSDSGNNNKFNPGKLYRTRLTVNSMRESSSALVGALGEAGVSDVSQQINMPAGMLPAASEKVKLGLYLYSYSNQQSITEPRRFKLAGLPVNFGTPAL